MRQLHGDVAGLWKDLIEEGLGLGGSPGTVPIDRRANVDHDGELVLIGCAEHGAQLFDVAGVEEVYVGIAKVELESFASAWLLLPAPDLVKRVVL